MILSCRKKMLSMWKARPHCKKLSSKKEWAWHECSFDKLHQLQFYPDNRQFTQRKVTHMYMVTLTSWFPFPLLFMCTNTNWT